MSDERRPTKFQDSDDWRNHQAGNSACPGCEGEEDFPQKHECGGLVHVRHRASSGLDFIRVIYFKRCDSCDYQDTSTHTATIDLFGDDS